MVKDDTPVIQSIITGVCSSVTMVSESGEFFNREIRNDLPQDYVHWGLLFPKDTCGLGEDGLNEASHSSPSGLALQITSQWDPPIRSLLELQDKSLTSGMRVYSACPEIGSWEPSSHITVLGDAVHLMSPSGGVGAVATADGVANLAQIIADKQGVLSVESIGKFEQMVKHFAGLCLRRSSVAGEKMLNTPPAERYKTVDLYRYQHTYETSLNFFDLCSVLTYLLDTCRLPKINM